MATVKTSLLEIEVPEEFEDPYWTEILAAFNKYDQWIQANVENESLFIHTEGDVTLNSGSLAWSANILIRSRRSGKTLTVLPSNVALGDGEIFYVIAPARPIADATVAIQAGNPALPVDNVIPLGMRVGTRIYFFNMDEKPFDKTYVSGSIAGGADWDGHIEMNVYIPGVNFQLVLLKMTVGTEISHDIRIYDGDPAGSGVIKYQATSIDLDAADHEDPNVWFFLMPTPGDFYFKVTNNGGGAVEYSLRLRMQRA